MSERLVPIIRALTFVAIALVACGLIFALAGYPSLTLFASIAQGALFSNHAIVHTLRWAMPLFITALGVIVTFRCGYFNIGAQGQFYLGAIGASFAADRLIGLSAALVIPLAMLAGAVAGALWALWPGLLRLRSGTDEVITTLMGNFIAGFVLLWVTAGILKDDSGSGQVAAGRPVAAAFRIATSSGVSFTLAAIVIALGIAVWLLIDRTWPDETRSWSPGKARGRSSSACWHSSSAARSRDWRARSKCSAPADAW
jgi:ABC-type uncharacterized transport system permease subunit